MVFPITAITRSRAITAIVDATEILCRRVTACSIQQSWWRGCGLLPIACALLPMALRLHLRCAETKTLHLRQLSSDFSMPCGDAEMPARFFQNESKLRFCAVRQ